MCIHSALTWHYLCFEFLAKRPSELAHVQTRCEYRWLASIYLECHPSAGELALASSNTELRLHCLTEKRLNASFIAKLAPSTRRIIHDDKIIFNGFLHFSGYLHQRLVCDVSTYQDIVYTLQRRRFSRTKRLLSASSSVLSDIRIRNLPR